MISRNGKIGLFIVPALLGAYGVGCGGGNTNSALGGNGQVTVTAPNQGPCTGSITISAINASNGSTAQQQTTTAGAQVVFTLQPATYTMQATNSSGCTASGSVGLAANQSTSLALTYGQNSTAGGGNAYISVVAPNGGACTGTLTITATNQSGQVAQQVSVAAGASTQLNVPAGAYTVSASGGSGCTASAYVNATANANQSITLQAGVNGTSGYPTGYPTAGYPSGYPTTGYPTYPTYPYNNGYTPTYPYYGGYPYGYHYNYGGGIYWGYYPHWCYGIGCGGAF